MRLREHSHFIIAHRNLISTLCYYRRRSSLEYSEQRSFYDVNDNSFLPFSFVSVRARAHALFLLQKESSLFLCRFFSSPSDSNIIIMNNEGKHYCLELILCTADFSCWLHLLDDGRAVPIHCSLEERRRRAREPQEIFIIDRNEGKKDRVFCSSLLSPSVGRSLPRSLPRFNICTRWTNEHLRQYWKWTSGQSCVQDNASFVRSLVCMYNQRLIIEYTYVHRIWAREMGKQINETRK